jgi:hypothetical protein
MEDWTKRFALAALIGFFSALLAVPVACGGLLLVNQHRFGDVQAGGPAAVLGGMGCGVVVGIAVALVVWLKSRPR